MLAITSPRTTTREKGSSALTKQLWVVVPAFNEGERIAKTLRALQTTTLSGNDWIAQIVVIDDGSRDNTIEVARRFPVWILRHPINCGQGAAIQTGIDFAIQNEADILVTFDADNQHSASEIKDLIAPILDGKAQVSLGSRFLGSTISMPVTRRILLQAATWYTRLTTGLPVTDTHNGFRAISRKAAQKIRLRQPRMAHASEILEEIARHRISWKEVPVTIRYSDATLAKGQSGWDAVRIVMQLLVGRLVP